MRHLFDILRKIKMKCLLNFKKIYFVNADFKYYSFLPDFLKKNRDSGDYTCFLLDDLLNSADPHKIIHGNVVVLPLGKIIAFYYRLLFPNHYLWGGGLTVDSRFRKLGLARHLIEIDEGIARQYNIKCIKTVVVSHNIPIFKKLGFSEVRPWYILGLKLDKIKAVDAKSHSVREAGDSDLECLKQFPSGSDYFVLANQMYAEDLTWYPLDRLWLGDLVKNKRVLLNEDKSGIRGLAIINKKSLINPFPAGSFSIAEIGYFDGDWLPILDFIHKNYHPDFVRIYSAEGIPLKCLPAGIKNGYFVWFNSLFGGLSRLNPSEEKLYFTSVMLMQKIISDN